jgi:hypothetical protein
LRETFSDEIKRKHPMVFTGASDIANKERNLFGDFMNLARIASGSTLSGKD